MPEAQPWQLQALAPYTEQTELWATWDQLWTERPDSIHADVKANVLVVESPDRTLLLELLQYLAARPVEMELSLVRRRSTPYQEAMKKADEALARRAQKEG